MHFNLLISQINLGYKLKKTFIIVKKNNSNYIFLKLLEKEKLILSFKINFTGFLVYLYTNSKMRLIIFQNKKKSHYIFTELKKKYNRYFSKFFYIITNKGIFSLEHLIFNSKIKKTAKNGGSFYLIAIKN